MKASIRMKAKELIKELDPDYEKCAACERKVHKTKLRDLDCYQVCIDTKECLEHFSRPYEYERYYKRD